MLDDSIVRIESPALVLALVVALSACRERAHETSARPAPSTTAPAAPSSAIPSSSAPSAGAPAASAPSCPEGMALVPGGKFWMGSAASEHFSEDEGPRFLTELAPYCLDLTEVTVAAYGRCVDRGACPRVEAARVTCNAGRASRGDHPMNCVTFGESEAFCKSKAARLPSEAEWEFAARGGTALRYPWGEGSPDGRACWKHAGTCAVKSFAAGAFGLFDISGNVWEWTDTWYGAYPFPPEHGFAKVYRGGSFSRRFEKWMHTRLRSRGRPEEKGSHLGFRCALTPVGVDCPFGRDGAGRCLHGVLARDCTKPGEAWNGVRCAEPGAPRCRPGRVEKPGFGCVLENEPDPASRDLEAEARSVSRARSPEFDADCQSNQRDRPHAFRYAGATHEARNLVIRRNGCKNRDVGVGWNSSCCP